SHGGNRDVGREVAQRAVEAQRNTYGEYHGEGEAGRRLHTYEQPKRDRPERGAASCSAIPSLIHLWWRKTRFGGLTGARGASAGRRPGYRAIRAKLYFDHEEHHVADRPEHAEDLDAEEVLAGPPCGPWSCRTSLRPAGETRRGSSPGARSGSRPGVHRPSAPCPSAPGGVGARR